MPVYLFFCPKCSEEIEKIQGMDADNPNCGVCGGTTVKLPTSPSLIQILRKGGTPVRSKGYKEDYGNRYRKRLISETQ